jgi:hypothetical protein
MVSFIGSQIAGCIIILTLNITISLDENLISASREYAKKNNTSFNALVEKLLTKTVLQDPDFLSKEMIRLMNEAQGDSKRQKWTREELYDR